MLILICDAFDRSLPAKLARFGEVTDDPARLKDAHVALIRSKTKANREFIDQAPNLRLIVRGGVGLDNVDRPYAESKGITVRNTPEASSVAVAELAFGLMLAVPNRLVEAHNSMVAGQFLKKELKRTELFGKTLGLVGMGLIATEVAKRAQAFGMKVVAYRKSGAPSPYAEVLGSLEEVLKVADYLSLHAPLTDETKGMINAKTIAAMKDGVVIVNTGRGKCVVEDDLVAALESGKVAMYATDVYLSDPPPAESPIPKARNVLMTPHIGASSKENLLRIGDCVEKILDGFRA